MLFKERKCLCKKQVIPLLLSRLREANFSLTAECRRGFWNECEIAIGVGIRDSRQEGYSICAFRVIILSSISRWNSVSGYNIPYFDEKCKKGMAKNHKKDRISVDFETRAI